MNFESRLKSILLCFALPLSASPLFALEAAPIRISLAAPPISKWGQSCAKKSTKTSGIDIGVFTAYTCNVSGVQIAPGAEAGSLYGLQIGAVASFVDYGYGMQLGAVFTSAFYEYYGVQAAGIVNFTRYSFAGAQFGLINYLGPATGLQAGLLNLQVDGCAGPVFQVGGFNATEALRGLQIGIGNSYLPDGVAEKSLAAQLGIYNKASNTHGFQLGVYNYAGDIQGFQLGIINRAKRLVGVQIGLVNIVSAKYRKIGLPFTPVINVSW